jgi:type I restriction enzyme S subunit
MSRKVKGKKAIQPRLRFPEFRDAGEWDQKRLGDEGALLSSLTGKAGGDFDVGGAKFVTYINVFSNTFADPKELRLVDVKESERQNAVAIGDIFFTISSETPEEVGMSSVLLDDLGNCYLNSFCALFRFSPNKRPNPIFTGYLLRQRLVRDYFTKKAQGSTRFNLSKDAFKNLPFIVPSPPEQQKIADCLSSIDELIAAEGQKLDALKAHKKGLMQQLFPAEGETVPKLRFPEFRSAGEWEIKKLEALGYFTGGGTPSKETQAYWTGEIPWISSSDLTENSISQINISRFITKQAVQESATKLVPAKSILLVSRVGVGKLAVSTFPLCTSQDFTNFTPTAAEPYFLAYLLKSRKEILLSFNQGTSIKGFTKDKIASLELGFPSLPEQTKIADCLSSIDELIAAEGQKLDALKAHKKGLMQRLFPNLINEGEG